MSEALPIRTAVPPKTALRFVAPDAIKQGEFAFPIPMSESDQIAASPEDYFEGWDSDTMQLLVNGPGMMSRGLSRALRRKPMGYAFVTTKLPSGDNDIPTGVFVRH